MLSINIQIQFYFFVFLFPHVQVGHEILSVFYHGDGFIKVWERLTENIVQHKIWGSERNNGQNNKLFHANLRIRKKSQSNSKLRVLLGTSNDM